ncbi:unnamed protein product [Dovyalis caffra]|uniref:UspA domain-containing protein n=1 Tax=Dovyalis caffra TaxID=77055 RepID=A0AAV1SHT0_9ROSI|nr:unnamed protein product [Dovyalis caffra]
MDVRKIVVVVEDVEAARTALQWALHNLLRYGDLITLLHVFSPAINSSRSKKKTRLLRLKGFQLALSFKDICKTHVAQTNVEIIVTQGDREGRRIAAMVREIGASALVVGLHEQSFLYNLRVKLAIKYNTSPGQIQHLCWGMCNVHGGERAKSFWDPLGNGHLADVSLPVVADSGASDWIAFS